MAKMSFIELDEQFSLEKESFNNCVLDFSRKSWKKSKQKNFPFDFNFISSPAGEIKQIFFNNSANKSFWWKHPTNMQFSSKICFLNSPNIDNRNR